jgi:hypothetical protein
MGKDVPYTPSGGRDGINRAFDRVLFYYRLQDHEEDGSIRGHIIIVMPLFLRLINSACQTRY